MNEITIKINGLDADLGETSVNLNYNIFSFDRLDLRGLPSTYNVKIPKTNNNLRIIKEGQINKATVYVDFIVVISGDMTINGGDDDYFDCTILSSDADFIKEFGRKSLKDLKQYHHTDQIFKQHLKSSTRDTHYTPFALNYMLSRMYSTDILTGSPIINIDWLQHQKAKYKPFLKKKPLTFAIQSFGNFYRLPNKEVRHILRNGDLKSKSGSQSLYVPTIAGEYPEVRPYQGEENINPDDIKGYMPPMNTYMLHKKVSDTTLTPTKPIVVQAYINNFTDDTQSLDGTSTFSAFLADAQSYQYLEEGELYELALLEQQDAYGATIQKPTINVLYLGNEYTGNGRCWFTVVTDRLRNADLFDSLAYSDIPPVFNFASILNELFSQYEITLKMSEELQSKLSNEYLTYSGDAFIYNYKNHLGIGKINTSGSHLTDNQWYFDAKRNHIFQEYTQLNQYDLSVSNSKSPQILNDVVVTSTDNRLVSNTNVSYVNSTPIYQNGSTTIGANKYINSNFIGIWDKDRPELASPLVKKFDLYAVDGSFIVPHIGFGGRKLDKEVVFYTLPFYYMTNSEKQLRELMALPKTSYPLTAAMTDYQYSQYIKKLQEMIDIQADSIGVLDNSTLSDNKFTVETTTLEYDTNAGAVDVNKYTGVNRYGFGYRSPASGQIMFRVDFQYETPRYSLSEYGIYNDGIIPPTRPYGQEKPVYLILTKTKKFENYETLDGGVNKFNEPLPDNKTIVKYWKLTEFDGSSYRLGKQVLDTLMINVEKDEILNLYVSFQGYKYATNYAQPYDGTSSYNFTTEVTLDYSPEMYITKADVDIIFNGDYYIDVAKNVPDINQLKFFKDILVENRVLPYYDNVAKTLTLKSFNDVSKDYIVLDKFTTEDATYQNNFNQNILVQYKQDTSNINTKNYYGFKYEEKENLKTYKYEFDYSQSEDNRFKTYGVEPSTLDGGFQLNYANSYQFNPATNDTPGSKYDHNKFVRKGMRGSFTEIDSSFYSQNTGVRGYITKNFKQFKTIKITDKENDTKIAEDVDWTFSYNTCKVRVDNMFGVAPQNRSYITFDGLKRYNDKHFDEVFVGKELSVNTYVIANRVTQQGLSSNLYPDYGKSAFDSYFVYHSNKPSSNSYQDLNLTTVNNVFSYIPGYTQDNPDFGSLITPLSFNTVKLTAQRGQYKFNNGLLTTEYGYTVTNPVVGVNTTPILSTDEEIQSIASKDYNFLDTFYREYGLNYEKETLNNPTYTITGILPITDWYKITNDGIVKVWLDNSWYYLLSIDRYDVETERATIKVIRKIYGD